MRTRRAPSCPPLAAALLTALTMACSNSDSPVGPDPSVSSVVVTAAATTLTSLTESVQLTARVEDQDGNGVQTPVAWASSNAAVLEVDQDGRATATGNGEAAIRATAAGVTGSLALTVAQEIAGLAFTLQPLGAAPEVPLSPFEVTLVDARGQTVIAASDHVVLSLGSNPQGATLTGTTEIDADGGIARFTDVAVDREGSGLTLSATAEGVAAESDPFDVTSSSLAFDDFQAAALVIGQPDRSSGEQNGDGGVANGRGFRMPGGVAEGPDVLYVADIGNNRVVGFTPSPTSDGPEAAFALGQTDLVSSNSPNEPSASTLGVPREVVVADGKLIATDPSSNRVLIWNSLPTSFNAPADVVVGQPDASRSIPHPASRTTLSRPGGLAVAGERLFVADTNNNRIMVWNEIPAESGEVADLVLGQDDFTTEGASLGADGLDNPFAVWTDGTRLVVGDTGNRRVLVWNQIPTANGAPADFVIGAPDFDSEGPIATSDATTVGAPFGVASDGTSIFVSDVFGNRVMIFDFPTQNGPSAVGLLGQTDFTLRAPNDPNQDGTSEGVVSPRTMNNPRQLAFIDGRLFVADQRNHRILVFTSNR